MLDGSAITFFGPYPKKPLMFDPNVNGNVKARSVRVRGDGFKVNTTLSTANGTVMVYSQNGPAIVHNFDSNEPWGADRTRLSEAGFLYGEAGGHGNQTLQRVDTFVGTQITANVINPAFDNSNQMTLPGTSPRIRVNADKSISLVIPTLWGAGQTAPRSQGIVIVADASFGNAFGIETIPRTTFTAVNVFSILSQDTFGNIWMLSRDVTGAYWMTRWGMPSIFVGPVNIAGLNSAVASTTPLQFFNDGLGHLIFIMADGSIQQWLIDPVTDGNITFQRIIPVAGLNAADTAIMFERLQPLSNNVRNGFFISYTNGLGHAAIGLVRLTDFKIIESYDLTTYRFQDGSSFPVATAIFDVDYNRLTREMHFCYNLLANTWKLQTSHHRGGA